MDFIQKPYKETQLIETIAPPSLNRKRTHHAKSERILLVEADTEMLGGMETALVMAGYKVTLAQSAVEAMTRIQDSLKRGPFDLLIIDINLMEDDGDHLLRMLRSDFKLKCPALMISGVKSLARAKACAHHGAKSYLVRPFKGEQLVSEVAWCLKA